MAIKHLLGCRSAQDPQQPLINVAASEDIEAASDDGLLAATLALTPHALAGGYAPQSWHATILS
jgi:hypothetical protein